MVLPKSIIRQENLRKIVEKGSVNGTEYGTKSAILGMKDHHCSIVSSV